MRSRSKKRRHVSYEASVITYLDIMGFQKLVAERQPGEISRILRIVKEAVSPGSPELLKELRIQHFSDLAVRVLPIVPGPGRGGDVWFELMNLVHVQTELIEEGIFVRGGLTVGDIVKSWGLLYGPGLIQAYDLEQRATYPRIIVDSGLLRVELRRNASLRNPHHDYKTEIKYINTLVRKDSDGQYFVDYLRAIETEFEDAEVGYPVFLQTHRNHIVEALDKFRLDKRILKKYKWLRDYHNLTVRKRFRGRSRKQYVI